MAAIVLLLPAWPHDLVRLAAASLSPYTVVVSTLAARAVHVAALFALPVLAVALLRHRWFCRYACPTGLLADLAGRCRGRRRPRIGRVPPVGQWLILLSFGGACLGYPLFLWLDPLALFTAFCHAWRQGFTWTAWLCAAGLPLILLLSFLWPGLWCLRLCPLGAAQDLLSLGKVAPKKLRGTLRAKDRAPAGTDQKVGGWSGRPGKRGLSPLSLSARPLLRRTLFGLGLGAVGAGAMMRYAAGRGPKPLRPPGAAGEDCFAGLCQRCGSCARVCPTEIIHPHVAAARFDSLLTPVLRYDESYCLETCQRCSHVCPSGALRPVSPDEKPHATIGLARVDMSVCLLGEDHECGICRNHCPYEAIKIVFSATDYLSVPQVNADRCNGCGACQVYCPTSPVKAIVVRAAP